MYLTRRDKVDTIGMDGVGMEIDFMAPRAIDKDAYFIIRMPMRAIRLMGIIFVVDVFSLHFEHLKILVKRTFRQFVRVNRTVHFSFHRCIYCSPEGTAIGVPAGTGLPKLGEPSSSQVNC